MRIKTVIHYLGLLIATLGVFMLIPLGFSIYYQEPDYLAFVISASISVVFGLMLWRLMPTGKGRLSRREALMIVSGGWVLASIFGALPYTIAGTFHNYLDAYFEAMSGFTTTGATVLAFIEGQPHGILMWRSLTQWLGGMGIITLFVALFPLFGIGAVHLVEAEVPGPQAERLTPRIQDTAKALWLLYIAFSGLEVLLLYLARMPVFDALAITFSTMPTGGFTPTALSVTSYNSLLVEIIITSFMVIAGVNFGLYYYLLWKRQAGRLFSNVEFKLYITLLIGACLFITLNLTLSQEYGVGEAFRQSSFQAVSIMTTTGFVTANFNTWPNFSKSVLLILMVIGASAGSTGGALKVTRLLVLFKYAYRRILLFFNPRAVIPLKIGGNIISEGVVSSVIGMSTLYITILIAGFLAMSAIGLDHVSALSSVAATLGNVGPGLALVGPTANYLWIPALGKLVLIICMLVGRLEFFTVLSLLTPSFWKWR